MAAGSPLGPVPASPRVEILTDDPGWVETIEWAADRFSQAGLVLPPVTVAVHADKTACSGNMGLYFPGDPPTIDLCSGSGPDSRPSRMITLHELGHAWAEAAVSEETRGAFLDLRGLEAWFHPDLPSHLRGNEHAAEVLTWGLMDEPVPIVRIYDAQPEQLDRARLLVGAEAKRHAYATARSHTSGGLSTAPLPARYTEAGAPPALDTRRSPVASTNPFVASTLRRKLARSRRSPHTVS